MTFRLASITACLALLASCGAYYTPVSFVAQGDQIIAEDASPQTVYDFANTDPGGGPDEVGQTWTLPDSGATMTVVGAQVAEEKGVERLVGPALPSSSRRGDLVICRR